MNQRLFSRIARLRPLVAATAFGTLGAVMAGCPDRAAEEAAARAAAEKAAAAKAAADVPKDVQSKVAAAQEKAAQEKQAQAQQMGEYYRQQMQKKQQ